MYKIFTGCFTLLCFYLTWFFQRNARIQLCTILHFSVVMLFQITYLPLLICLGKLYFEFDQFK